MASDAITTLKAFEEMRTAQAPRDLDRIEVIEKLRKSIEEFELGVKLSHTKWCHHLHRPLEHLDIHRAPCLNSLHASLGHWVVDQCANAIELSVTTYEARARWCFPRISYPYEEMTVGQARTLLHKVLDCLLQPWIRTTVVDRTWAFVKSWRMQNAGVELEYAELSEALGGVTGVQCWPIDKQTLHYHVQRCTDNLSTGELLPAATTQRTLSATSNWALLAVWINLKRVERVGTSYSANMALRQDNQFKTIIWTNNKVGQCVDNMLGAIECMAGIEASFLDNHQAFGVTWRHDAATQREDNRGMADLIFTQRESMRMIPKPAKSAAAASVVLMEDVAVSARKRKIERLD